jgi:hypothetical protein
VTLTRSEQIEALTQLCIQTNASELLHNLANVMRYDPNTQRIIIDIPDTPDETFPEDPDLAHGPLTLAVWKMCLWELADALPPWDEP